MTRKHEAPDTGAMAPTSIDDRERARGLREEIEAGRDRIAELDLEIEDRLAAIAEFDASLHRQLRAERRTLDRTQALRRMLERWTIALEERPAERLAQAGLDIEARRVRELEQRQAEQADEDAEDPGEQHAQPEPPSVAPSPPPSDDLKSAYRRLARRYHPDLAHTEEDRVEFGRLMARINGAYHEGDLDRLLALAGPAAPTVDDVDALAGAELRARLDALARERDEVARVLEDLEDRRARIEQMPTYRLWLRWQDAATTGGDFFATMREQLRERTRDAQAGIAAAISGLQEAVTRHNRRDPSHRKALVRQRAGKLAERFDPEAGQQLAQLLLDEADIGRSDPRVVTEADRIEKMATDAPARLRLLLLAHVAQLSDQPLPGLERHEDYSLRLDHLGREDDNPVALTEVMAELADVLEYGVRHADSDKVRLGFRFRSSTVREAMPLALLRAPVRRELRRVLQVLGETMTCSECNEEVFLVPLYRSTGFDSLRAVVCPACGHAHQRYWLPRGDDVQALLNPAYVELEIITEWAFVLGGQRGATQLLPVEIDSMTVGDLKQRIHKDLFERYEIQVRRGKLRLEQHGRRVAERTTLTSLEDRVFTLAFAKGVELDEADAAHMLRHRIRHRFD